MAPTHQKQTRVACVPTESAEALAQFAGLRYSDGDDPGFQRRPWGRGFAYFDRSGRHIRDAQLITRFKQLAIPPAWQDVWICKQPNGHIQVIGKDKNGRRQYIYHSKWEAVSQQKKYDRMRLFGEALPAIRNQVEKDLRRRALSREKVLALVVRLLDETMIRIGNPEYERQNKSYGLTTLRNSHVDVSTSRIQIAFKGKSGKMREIDIQDRRLARQVNQLHELPGQRLFQYIDERNQIRMVDSGDVNTYITNAASDRLTAKDFRTWGGTVLAFSELSRIDEDVRHNAPKRAITQCIKNVAKALGNTPTICRQYYIHPAVFEAFEAGSLPSILEKISKQRRKKNDPLDIEERAVLSLLQSQPC